MADEDTGAQAGMSRRHLIKRSAIIGGTVVWVAPAIQSFTSPAFAAGSPVCICEVCLDVEFPVGSGNFFRTNCVLEANSCTCVCCCVFGRPGEACNQCNGGSSQADACLSPIVILPGSCSAFIPGRCL